MSLIHIFGTLESPLQMSDMLRHLNVSHDLIHPDLKNTTVTVDLGFEQPAWPVIVPSVTALARFKSDKERQILFVCDCEARLKNCKFRTIKSGDLEVRLRQALSYALGNERADWDLNVVEPTVESYVSKATKASYLNDVQALFYKIVPYSLRTEVQKIVLGCLAGKISKSSMHAKLRTSHKLDPLKALVKDPRFEILKTSVAVFRATNSMEKAVAHAGLESFEILYVYKSGKAIS